MEDPVGVRDIINEVIDDLDLEKRRYKLELAEIRDSSDIETMELIDDNNDVTYVPINKIPSDNNITTFFRPRTYQQCVEDTNRISLPHKLSEEYIKQLENVFDQALTEGSSEEWDKDNKSKLIKNSSVTTIMFNKGFNTTSYADIYSLQNSLPKKDSATNNVKHLIDHILEHIKLEDSYVISEPSSDTCNKEHSIYFLNKAGTINIQEKELCTVYLPPVKTGNLF